MSTDTITAPATGATTPWFNLARHDDPEPEPETTPEGDPAEEPDEPEGEEPEPDGEGEPDGDDKPKDDLGERGQRALDRMKAERTAAKKEAAAAKRQAAELARKVQEFEDRDKSELDKATAKAERAADQATKAVARTVTAEIKVAAIGKFADTSDAVDALMRDPAKYVDSSGDIDTDAIAADLESLLERKPHWGIPEPAPAAAPEQEQKAPRRQPKPDPGQGSRGAAAPKNFLNASSDEVAAELAQYSFRQRSV